MPHRFRWHHKDFHWYQALRRGKKYYMIRIYREHSREIEIIDFKPTKGKVFGLHFMVWNPRVGPQPFGHYPTTYSLSQSVLLQVYANHLASPESLFQQFSLEDDYYSFVFFKTSDDIPLYLIIHSTEIDISSTFEAILLKFVQLISEKPSLVFNIEIETSSSIDPVDLFDWVDNYSLQTTFLKKIYHKVMELVDPKYMGNAKAKK
jgi:hypothetical protein